MAKDFENVDKIIKDSAKKSKFDFDKESYKWATMSLSELTKEFNKIEERYDKKFKELDDFRKKLYQDEFNTLTKNADFYKKMVLDSTDKDDRAYWTKCYMDNDLKLSALFATANAKLDEKEVRLEQEKKNDKKERVLMFVTKVALPVVLKAVASGITYYLTNSSTDVKALPDSVNTKFDSK